MKHQKLTPALSVSPQLSGPDLGIASARGFKSIVNNRPDGESEDQPNAQELAEVAEGLGLKYRHVPVVSGKVTDEDVAAFEAALDELPGPVLAFCRTGTRSTTLWALAQAPKLDPNAILEATAEAGYDLTALKPRLQARNEQGVAGRKKSAAPQADAQRAYDVVIVGGGAGGLAAAASLLKRDADLEIAVIEPSDKHYYQPGWTLVGGGVFDRAQTERSMKSVIPSGVRWVRAAVSAFEPEKNAVVLEDGERVAYRVLVAAPGLKLNWDGIEGLRETLGKNGVTSNYLFDMAPYTWELIQGLRQGRALFSQPPMPIKCAGAPQKAMYLACDHWRRTGVLGNIDVEFHNAIGVLFGVADYVPALMKYVERYGIDLKFHENLIRVDGPARKAWFVRTDTEGKEETVETTFDMLHVCPPQTALDFVKGSALANEQGWIDVNQETLQHTKFGNIFALGDGCSTANAKTAAAVRKQAPTVAENVIAVLGGEAPRAIYDGYGSCPLTVERGKIVLAEFGYGGKLLPTFPTWLIDGKKPSRLSWFLKEKMLPGVYFDHMLKGREWFVEPTILPHTPAAHEVEAPCKPEPQDAGRK